MDRLRELLAANTTCRRQIDDIVNYAIQSADECDRLYALTHDTDHKVAWHAAWACEKVACKDITILAKYYNDIIHRTQTEKYEGIRRLLLKIVWLMPDNDIEDMDLLDFCIEGVFASDMSTASRSLCVKIAERICRRHRELADELKVCLNMADELPLPTAVESSVRNTLKRIDKI